MPSDQAIPADHVSASDVAMERAPERVILIPLESRALRLLVLIVIVVGAALEHLRYVLAVDPAQADAAFSLAMAVLDPEVAPASLLPSEPEPLLAIVRLAIRNGDLPLAKALDFTTQSGVKLQVLTHDGEEVLGETSAIAGTTADWVTLEAHVQVPSDITLIILRVRREPAPGPEGNLGGKVWLDDITLTPVGGASG